MKRSGPTLEEIHLLAERRKALRLRKDISVSQQHNDDVEEEEEEACDITANENTCEEHKLEEIEEEMDVNEKEANKEEEKLKEKEEEESIEMVEEAEDPLPVVTHSRIHTSRLVSRQLPDWVTDCHLMDGDIATHSVPVNSSSLPAILQHNLSDMDIVDLFPIQSHVISHLLHHPLPHDTAGVRPCDVCVCAPTGCGKTLCYVLPVMAALLGRVVCRLRVLVVVPSQQLAEQVKQVFSNIGKRTGVKVGVVSGRQSVEDEEDVLVDVSNVPPCSGVDVLVATPGRLAHHLHHTPLFSLADLRYLIIDEADRLFEQHYHGWLQLVLDSVTSAPPRPSSLFASLLTSSTLSNTLPSLSSTLLPHHQPHNHHPHTSHQVVLQKLLFSATLSLDPEHLSLLHLHQPLLFTVSSVVHGDTIGQSALPPTLTEYTITCTADSRPLVVLHLLETWSHVLCFTESRETAHRLALLLQQYKGSKCVQELATNTKSGKRRQILNEFILGKTQVRLL